MMIWEVLIDVAVMVIAGALSVAWYLKELLSVCGQDSAPNPEAKTDDKEGEWPSSPRTATLFRT